MAALGEPEGHHHHLDDVVLTDDVERWLRWMARILSIVVVIAFAVAITRADVPGSTYVAWQDTASIAALSVAAAGLLLAWLWEGVGGAVTLVGGLFVGALAAYQYTLLLALGVALLFIVPALLFLLAWQRTQTWRAILVLAAVTTIALVVGAGVALAAYNDGHGPTHPSSETPPLPDDVVTWMWVGGVTDSTAQIVAKVPDSSEVILRYGSDAMTLVAEPETRGPVYRFSISGLDASTTYRYTIEADGRRADDRSGTFTTFTSEPMSFAVAFASCERTGSNATVFDTIRGFVPDLFLLTGDFHYGDVAENSLDTFAALYDTQLAQAAPETLYASVPIAYTWDDHDFGPNDAGGDSPSREAALASYRWHVPHYAFGLPGPDAPIAQAFSIGRVRFILTDTRSARTDSSVLGAEQLEWFLDELGRSAETHAVVVWVSSIPWIAEAEPGADHWGGYPEERERIAEFIADRGIADRLLMLAGDAHMLAIDDGSHNDYAPGGGASFPVMQAAALDRPGSVKGGPYSEGAYPGGGHFGLLEVEDDGGESIRIVLRGLDWERTVIVEYAFDVAVGS